MNTKQLREILLKNGRSLTGKIIQVPLRQHGKLLFADVNKGIAYSYFLVDCIEKTISEGHIFNKDDKKQFGKFDIPKIHIEC